MKRFFIYVILISTLVASILLAQEESRDIGDWKISDKIDPITDERIVLFTLETTSQKYNQNMILVVKFNVTEKTISTFIYDSYFNTDWYPILTVRFDKETPIEIECTNEHEYGKENTYFTSPLSVVKQMCNADVFVVRGSRIYNYYKTGSYSVNFDTEECTIIYNTKGLAEAIKPFGIF